MFVDDGGALDELGTADIQLPPDELRSWAWCDQEQIRERVWELLARRVIVALCTRSCSSTPAYVKIRDGHVANRPIYLAPLTF